MKTLARSRYLPLAALPHGSVAACPTMVVHTFGIPAGLNGLEACEIKGAFSRDRPARPSSHRPPIAQTTFLRSRSRPRS